LTQGPVGDFWEYPAARVRPARRPATRRRPAPPQRL